LLGGEIEDCTANLIREKKEKTRRIIENIIEAEQNYIFTNNAEYLTKRAGIIPVNLVFTS